jgi:hypothetical protein
MFVFERRFHRGVLVLLIAQVCLGFFTIYVLERLLHDEQRIPLEVDLALRRNMNSLIEQLHHQDPTSGQWDVLWKSTLDDTQSLFEKAKLPVSLMQSLRDIGVEQLLQDSQQRSRAQTAVTDIARFYDRQSTQLQKSYRLTIVGGAWSITLLSLASFLCLAYAHSQIKNYVLYPLREICQCLIDWKRGNVLRRCSFAARDHRMQRSIDILNECLDQYRPIKVMTPIERDLAAPDD